MDLNMYHFERWLESKQDTDVVGYVGSFESCPIATFIHETMNPEGDVKVSGPEVVIGDKSFVPPDWVDDFIAQVDYTDHDSARVPAFVALNIITGIIEEYEEFQAIMVEDGDFYNDIHLDV